MGSLSLVVFSVCLWHISSCCISCRVVSVMSCNSLMSRYYIFITSLHIFPFVVLTHLAYFILSSKVTAMKTSCTRSHILVLFIGALLAILSDDATKVAYLTSPNIRSKGSATLVTELSYFSRTVATFTGTYIWSGSNTKVTDGGNFGINLHTDNFVVAIARIFNWELTVTRICIWQMELFPPKSVHILRSPNPRTSGFT